MACQEKFTSPDGSKDRLASRLIRVADRMRDIRVKLGLRPYMVHLVRTRWEGGVRGKGEEIVVSAVEILPVPLVSDLNGLALTVGPAVFDEIGTVVLSEVSGKYTEDQLRGRGEGGEPIPDDESFWYEVEFRRAGRTFGERRRFVARSAPTYQASRFQHVVTLHVASQGRGRKGEVR